MWCSSRSPPHPALSSYVSATAVLLGAVARPSRRLSRAPNVVQTQLKTFLSSIGTLTMLGVNSIDLISVYGRASRDPVYNIPYPFTKREFPLRIDGPRVMESPQGGSTSLTVQMNAKFIPDLAEHVVYGKPVIPSTSSGDDERVHRRRSGTGLAQNQKSDPFVFTGH